MKQDVPPLQSSGSPLNTLDKFFYSWKLLGSRPMSRILFKFKSGHIDIELLRQAYGVAIKRWPVLNSTIHEFPASPGWDVRWVPRDVVDQARAVKKYDFTDISAEAAEECSRQILFDHLPDYSSRCDTNRIAPAKAELLKR